MGTESKGVWEREGLIKVVRVCERKEQVLGCGEEGKMGGGKVQLKEQDTENVKDGVSKCQGEGEKRDKDEEGSIKVRGCVEG